MATINRHTPSTYDEIKSKRVSSDNICMDKNSQYEEKYKAILKKNNYLNRKLKLQSKQINILLEQKVKKC